MKENLYNFDYGERQARELPPLYKEKILEWLKPEEKDIFLELGFGSGDILDFLKKYCPKIVGADINKDWLVALKQPDTIAADARELPIKENTITKSLSLHTLEHIKEVDTVLKELDRVTVDGGLSLHAFPAPLISRLEGAFGDAAGLTKNFLEIIRLAKELHPHKLDPEKIDTFLKNTNWKIKTAEKKYIPEEKGSAWFVLLEKQKQMEEGNVTE